MTAGELIEKLKEYPPDTRVVVRGYEDGYNDILELHKVKIKLNASKHWYEGAHKDSEDEDAVEAINLFGENKNAKY